MHCVSSCEGVRNITIHVEVDAVTTNNLWLTTLSKLSIGYLPNKSILGTSGHHEVGTIAFFLGCLVSSDFDVSGEKTNLSSHLELVLSSIGLYP